MFQYYKIFFKQECFFLPNVYLLVLKDFNPHKLTDSHLFDDDSVLLLSQGQRELSVFIYRQLI